MTRPLHRVYRRWQRRRWLRRCALGIVRHSAIGWEEAMAKAGTMLDANPHALRWVHPTDAAYIELGILEENLF